MYLRRIGVILRIIHNAMRMSMAVPLSDSASADNGVLRKDVLGDWLGTSKLWGHDALEGIRG